MTQIDLEDWLTSSQGDTPASPSRQPGSAEAIKMTDTSGRKCLGLSKLSGPAGSLEKTLLATSLWASTRCYLTWKAQATPAGATFYRLSPQMPRTDETAAGLLGTPTATANQMSPSMKKCGWQEPQMWATPSAADSVGTTGGGQNKSLRDDVKMWPTPTAHNAKEGGYPAEYTRNTPTLTAVAMASETGLWPTPAASDNRDRGHLGMPSIQRRMEKGKQLNLSMVVSQKSGSLNPNWVEWLMGYPVGYTDLNN